MEREERPILRKTIKQSQNQSVQDGSNLTASLSNAGSTMQASPADVHTSVEKQVLFN